MNEVKVLQNEVSEMAVTLRELDRLEDFRDADYSDASTDIGFVTVMLEQRRDRLMKRGRTL